VLRSSECPPQCGAALTGLAFASGLEQLLLEAGRYEFGRAGRCTQHRHPQKASEDVVGCHRLTAADGDAEGASFDDIGVWGIQRWPG
jgi:hypothetical protein